VVAGRYHNETANPPPPLFRPFCLLFVILLMPLEPPFYNPLFSDGPPPASSPVVVLSCAPMLDIVVQYLSPGDVARLQCTCRAIYEALIIWKRAAYNVNRFLGRFFKDPVAFRILQAQTNLLISGSFPLQFMDRYVLSPGSQRHHSSPFLILASTTRTAIWTPTYRPRAHEKL